MEQPFNTYYGTALETAVQNGTIPVSAMNTMVQHILTEMFRFNLFNQPRTGSHRGQGHHARARGGGHPGRGGRAPCC